MKLRLLRRTRPGLFAALLLVLALVLLFPQRSEAYAGPGAGFAVLSSFWTIFVAFLYSFYALVTWPIRQLLRMFRRRKAYGKAQVKRVVIVGFDGMDPELASRFMSEGKLPNLAKLRDSGTFRPLRTTFPAISPVAWSTFQTGVNPGKHNIYDFLARDLKNYLPYLSSARISEPKRHLKIGKYSLPLGKSDVKGLRKGTPFWHWLGKAGVFCSVIRVPVTFPPEKFPGVLLSGMCVPDLKGSQGTFCFCTTRASSDKFREGGVRIPIERNGAGFHSYIPGPENPLGTGSDLRADFKIRPDVGRGRARIEIDSENFTVKVGEYSEWIPVKFKAGMGFTARGICRFYLKEISPEVEVYVTPVNIDPGTSRPAHLSSRDLFDLSGEAFRSLRYAGSRGRHLGAQRRGTRRPSISGAVLRQSRRPRAHVLRRAGKNSAGPVRLRLRHHRPRPAHVLALSGQRSSGGRDVPQNQKPRVIQDLYDRMDTLVGRVMQQIDDQTLLLVISDHGFKSFNRCMNLNAWLHQNGYLVLKDGKRESGDWFEDVAWSRTRAYTMGLNGLYMNIKGREREGIVEAGAEAEALKEELRGKLDGLVDPASGKVGITGMFDCDAVYAGPYVDNAPDLIVGYGEGFRASWDSVMGKVTTAIFEDNLKAWSGDHCVDPRLVPGVLFSNRKIAIEKPAIVDVAPTVMKLFGLELPAYFDGKPWAVATTIGK